MSKTPLILHPSIYGMLAWRIKAFSFEGDSCPSRETCVILGSMYNGISEFVRLWAFKRAVRAFSTLRHIIVVAARAPVVANGGQDASSTAALAHRKELPMKGDMGQENRYALDANADTIVSDSRAPGLMSIAARLLKDGCTSSESFVASPACLYIAIETLARGAKGETLNELESALGGAAARRDAWPCCLRNAPNKLRAVIALPLRHRYGRTSSPLPCGEASAAQ